VRLPIYVWQNVHRLLYQGRLLNRTFDFRGGVFALRHCTYIRRIGGWSSCIWVWLRWYRGGRIYVSGLDT